MQTILKKLFIQVTNFAGLFLHTWYRSLGLIIPGKKDPGSKENELESRESSFLYNFNDHLN
jgi:hypothetical protein